MIAYRLLKAFIISYFNQKQIQYIHFQKSELQGYMFSFL